MNFFTPEFFVRLAASLVGAVAFAVIFKTNAKHLPFVAVSGLFTYAIYYTVDFFGAEIPLVPFLAAFLSTLFTALFSEVCARVERAPAAVFLFPGIIPTVPGGDLYYTMQRLLAGDTQGAFAKLASALLVGLGIAGGIMVVSIVVGQITDYRRKRRLHEPPRKDDGDKRAS